MTERINLAWLPYRHAPIGGMIFREAAPGKWVQLMDSPHYGPRALAHAEARGVFVYPLPAGSPADLVIAAGAPLGFASIFIYNTRTGAALPLADAAHGEVTPRNATRLIRLRQTRQQVLSLMARAR